MKEKILHLIEVFDLKRFIKFGFIGVLNTLVDFVVFYLLNRFVIKDGPTLVLLGATIVAGPYISNAISYVVANIHSFIWNKFWTFQKKEPLTRREVGRYIVTSCGFLIISSIGLSIFMSVFQLPAFAAIIPAGLIPLAAKIPNTCVTMFYNYLMNKFWVFK